MGLSMRIPIHPTLTDGPTITDPGIPILEGLQAFVDQNPRASQDRLRKAVHVVCEKLGMKVMREGCVVVLDGKATHKGWEIDVRPWLKQTHGLVLDASGVAT